MMYLTFDSAGAFQFIFGKFGRCKAIRGNVGNWEGGGNILLCTDKYQYSFKRQENSTWGIFIMCTIDGPKI
eukprot:12357917-Ditylum_brightwellii.AAC.1